MRRLVLLAVLALGPGCISTPPLPRTMVHDAEFPVTLAPLEDGGLLYAERVTGRIRHVDPSGRLRPDPVAEVSVSTGGHRGLLGLATRDHVVYAAWTDPEGTILVGQVAPGPVRVVWRGPPSAQEANGGRIALASDGSIVVGIGDLLDPPRVADPDAPNGKLLRLDRAGPADQIPVVISGGWNNPFAFGFTPAGDLWVADNAPGRRPERLTRGDVEGPGVTDLPPRTAPSGLAVLGGREILVCGFVSRTLLRYRIDDRGVAVRDGRRIANDCSLDVAVLADGRIVYANESSVRILLRT